MEANQQVRSNLPRPGWAIWYQGKPVRVTNEIILQIRAMLIDTLGWCEEDLLFDCRLLLDKIPHTKVKRVFREANKCVNALARKGCNSQEEFVIFYVPPSDDISALVYADENGESFCRHVAANLAVLAA